MVKMNNEHEALDILIIFLCFPEDKAIRQKTPNLILALRRSLILNLRWLASYSLIFAYSCSYNRLVIQLSC
jgi:hypothetical protein